MRFLKCFKQVFPKILLYGCKTFIILRTSFSFVQIRLNRKHICPHVTYLRAPMRTLRKCVETAARVLHACSEEKLATLSLGFAFLHGLLLGSGGNAWKRPQVPRTYAPKESSQRSRQGLLFFTVFLGSGGNLWKLPQAPRIYSPKKSSQRSR